MVSPNSYSLIINAPSGAFFGVKMLKVLEERIAELTKSAEQGIANHNFLLGSLNEAKHLLEVFLSEKAEKERLQLTEECAVFSESNP